MAFLLGGRPRAPAQELLKALEGDRTAELAQEPRPAAAAVAQVGVRGVVGALAHEASSSGERARRGVVQTQTIEQQAGGMGN